MKYRRQRRIQPKLSAIPRRKSEDGIYRSLYQLSVEKKRLQQELSDLQDRSEVIQQRLSAIEGQLGKLEADVKQLGDPSATQSAVHPPQNKTSENRPETPSKSDADMNTFMVDY
ncbi:sugar ABC transporter ATP-binding protein [Lyngbya sp. CCY1209]|jgi:predicted  nucleic acid-binding Zn-ribbon protein|uniref:sugar ABC transporter ATP-binding protein n=1 Tax=Lyngbya sp. CCY1209 TaxID=2886103 RepID=UPI002D20CF25|nr:sugar ABC transporter ATP-binding protein [Lyngbya sp. CCY1209]MEB3882996.1 sugar ABC transporter ATP-binding protein [Lyngbya sp. CCY1209]